MERECVNLLCELHKAMLNSEATVDQSGPAVRDAKVVMEATNTLEALQRHQPATALFESLSQPSKSESARAINEKYCRGEFGKRAMMRHIFGDDTYAQARHTIG